ncbi:MAG: phosphotransferase [Pseudomonadota bacterium]
MGREVAPQAALEAWGGGKVLTRLKGGARSTAFMVDTAGGFAVLRRHSESEASLRWLRRALRLTERAGLTVPHPIAAEGGWLGIGGWRLERWIDGKPAAGADLKRLSARIAAVHRSGQSLPDRPGAPPLADWATDGAPVLELCRRATAKRPFTLIHGDLHVGNLLRLPGGGYALLDWDEARRDSPAFDMAALVRPSGSGAQKTLHLAYETASGWRTEPAYARGMARRLMARANRPCS